LAALQLGQYLIMRLVLLAAAILVGIQDPLVLQLLEEHIKID
jgi:hypothetical protein